MTSQLFTGVNPHYARHGWETVPTARVICEIPAASLPEGIEAHYFTPDDLAAMRGLYDLYAPKYGGVIVRDSWEYWDKWVRKHMRHAHVLSREGRMIAYAVSGNVREDAPGGARFDVTEFIAAPRDETLLPALLCVMRGIGNLPGRVRIPRPLWPDARDEVTQSDAMMLRLNRPFELDGPVETTRELIEAVGDPVAFAVDDY